MIIIEIDNNNDELSIKGEDYNLKFPIKNPVQMKAILLEVLNAVNRATKGVSLNWVDEDTRTIVDEW